MKCPLCNTEMADDFRRYECKNQECDFGSSLRSADISLLRAALSAAHAAGFAEAREMAASTARHCVTKSYNEKLMTANEQIAAAIRALQPKEER